MDEHACIEIIVYTHLFFGVVLMVQGDARRTRTQKAVVRENLPSLVLEPRSLN